MLNEETMTLAANSTTALRCVRRRRKSISLPAISRLTFGFGLLSVFAVHGEDWPQWLGPQRDGVWRETGIVEKFTANGLKYRWRVPIGGGYSGPAVANGRVYLMDRQLATN